MRSRKRSVDHQSDDPDLRYRDQFIAALRHAARVGGGTFGRSLLTFLGLSLVIGIVSFLIAKSGNVLLAGLLLVAILIVGGLTGLSASLHRAAAEGLVAGVEQSNICRRVVEEVVRRLPDSFWQHVGQAQATNDLRQRVGSRLDRLFSSLTVRVGVVGWVVRKAVARLKQVCDEQIARLDLVSLAAQASPPTAIGQRVQDGLVSAVRERMSRAVWVPLVVLGLISLSLALLLRST